MSVALGGLYQFGETEARSSKLFVSPSPDPTAMLQGDGTHLLTPPPSPRILLFKGKTNLALGKHSFVQDLSREGPATPRALCVCISCPKWLLPSASVGGPSPGSPLGGGVGAVQYPPIWVQGKDGNMGNLPKILLGCMSCSRWRVGGPSNHPTPSATPPP